MQAVKRLCSRWRFLTKAKVDQRESAKGKSVKMDIFTKETRQLIAQNSIPLHLVPKKRDYDELIDAIGSAQIVLIGEASHGTHEFYRERALITKRLIEEKDFTCVAVEGDFPDVFRVNQYVQKLEKHGSPGRNANEALSDFTRFPLWMWRNYVVQHFVEWLRSFNNRAKRDVDKVCMAGLDVYSLHRSAESVIEYLEKVDPKAAKSAADHYECFEKFGADTTMYAFAARHNLTSTCEKEALKVLEGLKSHTDDYLKKTKDGLEMETELFNAVMNAFVVEGAERYYRVMLDADATSWNVRDDYMVSTLQRLIEWKTKIQGRPAKAVVWAHNSHLGDARYTEMGRRRKEHNIGQLARQRFGDHNVYNVGFSTYTGEVTCASNWSQKKIERKTVSPGMAGSYEKFFHDLSEEHGINNFVTFFKRIVPEDSKDAGSSGQKQSPSKKVPTAAHPFPKLPDGKSFKDIPVTSFPLERAIGVIYRPETERQSHYFEAFLSEQFDAVIHIDKTTALLALDDQARKPGQEEENLPELFPFGL